MKNVEYNSPAEALAEFTKAKTKPTLRDFGVPEYTLDFVRPCSRSSFRAFFYPVRISSLEETISDTTDALNHHVVSLDVDFVGKTLTISIRDTIDGRVMDVFSKVVNDQIAIGDIGIQHDASHLEFETIYRDLTLVSHKLRHDYSSVGVLTHDLVFKFQKMTILRDPVTRLSD